MNAPTILGVVSSSRSRGHTHSAVQAVLVGAADGGADTEMCTIAIDGPERVLTMMERADGIVIGSPVYRASFAADLKDLLEHTERGLHGETTAPLQGKATAIVMTGASHHHFLSTSALRDVLSSFFAAQVLSPGLYLAHDAFAENALLQSTADLARQHGAALLDLTAAVRASHALIRLEPQV